jgi:hypothetical protein
MRLFGSTSRIACTFKDSVVVREYFAEFIAGAIRLVVALVPPLALNARLMDLCPVGLAVPLLPAVILDEPEWELPPKGDPVPAPPHSRGASRFGGSSWIFQPRASRRHLSD